MFDEGIIAFGGNHMKAFRFLNYTKLHQNLRLKKNQDPIGSEDNTIENNDGQRNGIHH